MIGFARYVQTGTQRSNATSWVMGVNQAWFNTTRKTSSYVTKTTTGTPSVDAFTLNAAGIWEVDAGLTVSSGTAYIGISSTAAETTEWGRNGTDIASQVSASFEANLGTVIYILWNLSALGTVSNSFGDSNHASFKYFGPVS